MHELTLCQNLLDILDSERRKHGFRSISRLKLEIGRFSCLDPDAFEFSFGIAARETFAADARLEIDRPPGQARCLECGAAVEVQDRLDPCPVCGSLHLDATGGDELRLIEMEVR